MFNVAAKSNVIYNKCTLLGFGSNVMATYVNNYTFMLSVNVPSGIAIVLRDNRSSALNEVYSSTAARYLRQIAMQYEYSTYKNVYSSEKTDQNAVDLF